MATAKASAAGDGSPTTTRVGARKPPAIHALPVNDASTPKHVEPGNPAQLPVRPGEDDWTEAELTEVIEVLEADIVRFAEQLQVSTAELVGMLRDGTEGAGRDPADVGSANFERDAEMSLANNAREMLDQSKLALRHIQLGTYGSCDNCGQPIGKGRLQAFPRATLCVKCKQREERR
jgi:DnaK suppressor protein